MDYTCRPFPDQLNPLNIKICITINTQEVESTISSQNNNASHLSSQKEKKMYRLFASTAENDEDGLEKGLAILTPLTRGENDE